MKRVVGGGLALALLSAGVVVGARPAEAKPQCKAVEGYDVTICVSVTSNDSVQKGRVFQGGEDVFGVVSFGISQTDEECKKDKNGNRPKRKNCKTASGKVGADFITPFSTFDSPFVAFCGVETLGSDGCGGRSLKEGLKYVVGFDSAQGAFAIHKAPGGNIGESKGCVRASTSVSKFVWEAYDSGSSVALVVLDRRG